VRDDRTRAHVTLGLIGVVTCVSFIDRVMIGAIAPLIKADLGLSDTQLGIVAGVAFTFFYSICGLLLAIVADRHSRRKLIAISVAVWSLATAACGVAQNFWQLAAARFAVGFGEAGAGPASFSLICDLYPERSRAPAVSVYVIGAMLGTTLGLSLAAWLASEVGWRATFILIGLPGCLLAVVCWLFVREPPRGVQETSGTAQPNQSIRVSQTLAMLAGNRPYVLMAFANGLAAFCTYGMTLWLPSFLTRSHGLTLTQVSVMFGLPFGIALIIGALCGGGIGAFLTRRGVHMLWLAPVCMFLVASCYVVGLSLGDVKLAILLFVLAAFLTTLCSPAYTAHTLTIVDPRIRATAQAIVNFMNSILAYAIGTLAVGILSDALNPRLGEDSLRWALIAAQIICASAGILYLIVLRGEHAAKDKARTQRQGSA
jgi:predicted MFS family arabinose efflux permease